MAKKIEAPALSERFVLIFMMQVFLSTESGNPEETEKLYFRGGSEANLVDVIEKCKHLEILRKNAQENLLVKSWVNGAWMTTNKKAFRLYERLFKLVPRNGLEPLLALLRTGF